MYVRLRLAVGDLVAELLKGRSGPLSELGRARAVLYFVFIYVVLYRLEVNGELGVVRQGLILRIIFVKIEVVVVRYVRIGLDCGNVTGRSRFTNGRVEI